LKHSALDGVYRLDEYFRLFESRLFVVLSRFLILQKKTSTDTQHLVRNFGVFVNGALIKNPFSIVKPFSFIKLNQVLSKAVLKILKVGHVKNKIIFFQRALLSYWFNHFFRFGRYVGSVLRFCSSTVDFKHIKVSKKQVSTLNTNPRD
jgi:hypothetical protein